MHNPSGSFRPSDAARFFWSAAAHGWNGSPSLNPAPAFPPFTSGAWLGVPFGSGPSYRIQTPDKSGLPSAPRGAGALRFGLPSGPFGTPGTGRNGHCADNDDDTVTTMAINTAVESQGFMSAS